jgi:D-alanyl-lipoteichoic acid acyltransferase DltB (MBOAT superfamily)
VGFSYVALRFVDAARVIKDGRCKAPDFLATINYLVPFHMLAAGPIQSYQEFTEQPGVPKPLGLSGSLTAIERIVFGLSKKYVVANMIERSFLTGFRAPPPYFFLELQLNYLWLYLDFSAYSDVAIGIGSLIGVATPENFNKPYLARNVIDFWERWHISLSMFIRRNLFIPLQLAFMRLTDGSLPLIVASVAFSISFLVCGLWHQPSLPWFLWGAYQAAGLIICNFYRDFLLKRLGRKGLNRYLGNPWIRRASTVLTFEFAAVGVLIVTYPLQDL